MTGTAHITLIHTNDLHSNLERWPQMVSVILSEIESAQADGRKAIYLDAGDHMDMSDRTCLGTRGLVNVQLLDQAGCAAFTIGNNELLRMKISELITLAGEASFPWLAANLRLEGGMPLPTVLDWTMLNVGGVQVGIFGLTAPFPAAGPPLGVEFAETDQTVKRCVGELRGAGADLVIFLSHIGLDEDRRVAALPNIGIDLIVGGHSHTLLEQPEVVAGIPIVQAEALGGSVGRIDLEICLTARRLSHYKGWLIPIDPDRTPANETVAVALQEAQLDAEAALAEIITVIPVDLSHDPLGTSKLATTLAEVLRQYTDQAEIGLVPGVLVAHGLEAGPISRSDLLDAISCLYIPTLLAYTGRHLLGLLDQAEDPNYYNSPVYVGGTRPMGSPLGRVFASGLTYNFDQTAPANHKVSDLRINGQPVDPQRLYRVGAPGLLGFSEVYPSLKGVKVLRRWMPETIRDVFEGALRSGLVLSLT